MLGYKVLKHENKRVVATLEILGDHNMGRGDVADKMHAKYRTNKVKVISIDAEGRQYDYARSFCYDQKSLKYKVGYIIEVDDFDTDLDKVCSSGIHYFLDYKTAYFYNLSFIETVDGSYRQWYDNGNKHIECYFENGIREGEYHEYYENGNKHIECYFKNGIRNGKYQECYENGSIKVECYYKNGKKYI